MLMIVKAKTNDFLGGGEGREERPLPQRLSLPQRFLGWCKHVDSRVKPTELLSTEAKDLARGNQVRRGTCRNQARRLCCGGSINHRLFKENTRPECPINLIGNQSHRHLLSKNARDKSACTTNYLY